jgi:hypothetical protein
MATTGRKFDIDSELEALILVHIQAYERIRRVTYAAHLPHAVSVHLIKQTPYNASESQDAQSDK